MVEESGPSTPSLYGHPRAAVTPVEQARREREEALGGFCRCREFTGPRCPLCGLPCLKDNESHAPLRLDLTYWPIWREP